MKGPDPLHPLSVYKYDNTTQGSMQVFSEVNLDFC